MGITLEILFPFIFPLSVPRSFLYSYTVSLMSVIALQTFDNSPMILCSGILKDLVPFVASYITLSRTSPPCLPATQILLFGQNEGHNFGHMSHKTPLK